jgi:hypothetical protein
MGKRQFVVDDPYVLTADEAVRVTGTPVWILNNCVKSEDGGGSVQHRLFDPGIGRPSRKAARHQR